MTTQPEEIRTPDAQPTPPATPQAQPHPTPSTGKQRPGPATGNHQRPPTGRHLRSDLERGTADQRGKNGVLPAAGEIRHRIANGLSSGPNLTLPLDHPVAAPGEPTAEETRETFRTVSDRPNETRSLIKGFDHLPIIFRTNHGIVIKLRVLQQLAIVGGGHKLSLLNEDRSQLVLGDLIKDPTNRFTGAQIEAAKNGTRLITHIESAHNVYLALSQALLYLEQIALKIQKATEDEDPKAKLRQETKAHQSLPHLEVIAKSLASAMSNASVLREDALTEATRPIIISDTVITAICILMSKAEGIDDAVNELLGINVVPNGTPGFSMKTFSARLESQKEKIISVREGKTISHPVDLKNIGLLIDLVRESKKKYHAHSTSFDLHAPELIAYMLLTNEEDKNSPSYAEWCQKRLLTFAGNLVPGTTDAVPSATEIKVLLEKVEAETPEPDREKIRKIKATLIKIRAQEEKETLSGQPVSFTRALTYTAGLLAYIQLLPATAREGSYFETQFDNILAYTEIAWRGAQSSGDEAVVLGVMRKYDESTRAAEIYGSSNVTEGSIDRAGEAAQRLQDMRALIFLEQDAEQLGRALGEAQKSQDDPAIQAAAAAIEAFLETQIGPWPNTSSENLRDIIEAARKQAEVGNTPQPANEESWLD